MRRKGLWLSVLATAMIAGSASAGIDYDGVGGFNFFTYNGVVNTNDWDYTQVGINTSNGVQSTNLHYQEGSTADFPAGAPFVEADDVYTHGEGTGLGGDNRDASLDQRYDVEQLFWAYEGDETGGFFHVGIVTGFNSRGVVGNDHYAGDLFLAFGNGPVNIPSDIEYDLAIGTSNPVANVGTNINDPVGRINNVWENDGSWLTTNADPFDYEADPWRYESGGNHVQNPNTSTNLAQVQWTESGWNGTNGLNRHNFLTTRLTLDNSMSGHQDYINNLLGLTGTAPFQSGNFTMHWTMGCGNDAAHHTEFTFPTAAPLVPVPAAAPLGLLGMGLLALVRRVRRRPEC